MLDCVPFSGHKTFFNEYFSYFLQFEPFSLKKVLYLGFLC